MKTISIIGSTGSIGTQVLDVAARMPDKVRVAALAAHRNVRLLAEQAIRFQPELVCIGDENLLAELRELIVGKDIEVMAGAESWNVAATMPNVDKVVISAAGTPGLAPTLAAVEAGKDIALASKEVLVAAGSIVTNLARRNGVNILPIDSEHSAIFQCLNGENISSVEKIWLTASGGPFRKASLEEMETVTPERALAHPTWKMGRKVTVDSATLMNKGLEIIEAHWLFGVSADNIEVVIHPQSIVHSMVRFADGSVVAQLGLPDMRLPIQYALIYPERYDSRLPRVDILEVGMLEFYAPDTNRFPALEIARDAARIGGTMPAVMNAADEVAVAGFLDHKIGFMDIVKLVEKAMSAHSSVLDPTLDDILKADSWARGYVSELMEG
jgi:1-deoxy-D-xylulose-5-phosphate reductoisomerase